MAKLDWLESFELGVDEIDDDHREMLAIMRDVEAAADASDFALRARLLDRLIDASLEHFRREEAYLERIGYPDLEAHKTYHADLVSRAGAVKRVCETIQPSPTFKDCCAEMFGFLVDDIVAGDLRFKSYLEQHHRGGDD